MVNKKLLEDRYPIVGCRDGLFRYEKVNGGINLNSRGYKSKSAASRARNTLKNIDHVDEYWIE